MATQKSAELYSDSHDDDIPILTAQSLPVTSDYGTTWTVTVNDELTSATTPPPSSTPETNHGEDPETVHHVREEEEQQIEEEKEEMMEETPNAIQETIPLINKDDENGLSPQWRDASFAIIFYLHLLLMLYLGIKVAPRGYVRMSSSNISFVTDDGTLIELKDRDQISFNFTFSHKANKSSEMNEEQVAKFEAFFTQAIDYFQVYPERIFWSIAFPSGAIAFVLSLLCAVYLYRPYCRTMVYGCLLESFWIMSATLIWASLSSHSFLVWVFSGMWLIAIAYYVLIAWRTVPFAAINLKMASVGVTSNCGLFAVAFLFMALGISWVLFWFYTAVGVAWESTGVCHAAHPEGHFQVGDPEYDNACDPSLLSVLFFLVSLYWTVTITMNLIQITVAGVIGTWCYVKDDANHCCSLAVWSSLYRSLTYSFGSVCFGSLLQGIVRAFRCVVEHARDQRNRNERCNGCGSFLLCMLECIASLLEDLIYIFNQYAYSYAGIYGLSYLESGRKVMDLFRARGWTTIITNNLVGYVLSFTVFTVGITTGFIGIGLEHLVSTRHAEDESFIFGPLPCPTAWAFGIAFMMGTWVCATMMHVIKGAVNTVMVCWADVPIVFELNHPSLCQEIAESWTSVFPDVYVYERPQATSSTDMYRY